MFLELLNNAFMDSSFFYLYFGIILVSLGFMYLIHLHNNHLVSCNFFFADKHQYIKINFNSIWKPLVIHESFIVWFITTFRRIEEKDDKEDILSSYFKKDFKIRGGQVWTKTAYSQPLKFSFYCYYL